ncbi:hypothetical protein [Paracoccus alkanivorans]|uniref:SDR family NAD(P)-dependent oxidoreductase n=1 Tax=Paracoccus alkanivorans TaxID=2116655 RepID=A0A3M0MCK6_9RHOB|nr:hypothetical protein [Paracoccus alkanivorans]RMC35045.1 hypothetical protein C9E81_13315 [Paracoccus alkanivorans]
MSSDPHPADCCGIQYIAKNLGLRWITVNIVAPGTIQTDASGEVVCDMTALGRAGQPGDIGPMIAPPLAEKPS